MEYNKNMLKGGFIENTRYLLKVSDTPQRELGAYLDTDNSLISRYLNGYTEPSYVRVMQIADFFSRKLGQFVPLDDLVGRTKETVFKRTKAAEPTVRKMGTKTITLPEIKKKETKELMKELLERLMNE